MVIVISLEHNPLAKNGKFYLDLWSYYLSVLRWRQRNMHVLQDASQCSRLLRRSAADASYCLFMDLARSLCADIPVCSHRHVDVCVRVCMV